MDMGIAAVLAALIAAAGSTGTVILTQRQNHKINETHRTLTTNHHSSPEPTVLDKLDDLNKRQTRTEKDVREIKEHLREQPSD